MLSWQFLELTDGVIQRIFLLLETLHFASNNATYPLSLSLNVELTSSSERYPSHLHLLVWLVILVPDHILETSVVSGVFELQYINVEDVVPQEVFFDMFLEIFFLFLDSFPGNITNITEVFFIFLSSVLFFS